MATTIKPIIRKQQINSRGKCNVKLQICHNRKTRYLSTNVYIEPESFDNKMGKVRSTWPGDYIQMNNDLARLERKTWNKLRPHRDNIPGMTIQSLMAVLRDPVVSHDFFTMIKKQIQYLDKTGRDGNKRVVTLTKDRLKKYIGYEMLEFRQITPGWLRGLEQELRIKGNSNSTIGIHMRNIRTIYNQAIDSGVAKLEEYPFRRYKIPKTVKTKRNLSVEKIREIKKLDNLTPYQARARDMFMLSFYLVGINLKDLLLYKGEINKGRIDYTRHKTKMEYSVLVHPEAQEIIDRYRSDGKYLLNVMDRFTDYLNARKAINMNLKKKIAKEIKHPGNLTTYYARHSWATIAKSIGISRDTIRLALGHGLNTITDIYIDYDISVVDEANREVIDKVIG